MDAVYAGVPASLVGREQQIDIGPLSGRSNVAYWLERRGLPADDDAVERILAAAKASNRTLTSEQILKLLEQSRTLPIESR
jgi:2-isopropylmalate synthase